MDGIAKETVGENFRADLLLKARDLTLRVIEEAAARIKPGTSEKEGKKIVAEVQKELGSPKSWHPPQIRFGENTILPFNGVGAENVVLQEDDIFFLDLGPVFEDHEGDVGRSFSLGKNPDYERCCKDAEEIWHKVADRWSSTQATGPELYEYAAKLALERGWVLSLQKANGHRVADFPHAARARGSVEKFPGHPAPQRWILEIQIRHPSMKFGAFYEDILN